MGIHVDVVEGYDGESRTCTIIRDASSNDHPTVVNEESPRVDEGAIEIMEKKIDAWMGQADAVLFTGSLSRGLSKDFYGRIIERANSRNVITAIDATGSVLRHGLEAGAVLVKANLEEISAVLGPLPVEPQALAAKIQKARNNVELETIVTMGEAGALLVAKGQAWCARPPRISKVNPIGAGDAFAAGYLKARIAGSLPVEALRFAVAVSASDAATPEPGWIITSEIASLVSETQVRNVDVP
jgi:fructose-1-phosphate kinase PfkB-like protein